jgi:WD40 repeat protein/serine/threonine protein kinase
MPQFHVCAQGHRWEAKAALEQQKPPPCPVCGLAAQTSAGQGLDLEMDAAPAAESKASAEAGAFQDLGPRPQHAASFQFEVAPEDSAFQDLGMHEDGARPLSSDPAKVNTAFQDSPRRPKDGPASIAPGAPGNHGQERSTAVTVRFPGVRREAPAKPWPALPGYEVLAEIGRSATSVVYQARDTNLQQIVAIKMITAGEYASARQTPWLRAARLQHPCIVPIHAVGEHGGRLYVVMDYVDGGTLEQRLRGRPQSPTAAAQMAETLARTIAYVHEQKLLHRNLKPSNILLTSDGMPTLTDFAMARTAERSRTPKPPAAEPDGMIGGNPSYLAPEHLQHGESASTLQRSATAATDIYALGAILYEMLTGRPPFLGATAADTIALVRAAEPIAPDRLQLRVPSALQAICLQCLQKSPEERYAKALELAQDLHAYLVDEPVGARAPAPWRRLAKWPRRHPWLVGSAALLLFCYTFLTAALIKQRSTLLGALASAESRTATVEQRLTGMRRALFLADMITAQEALDRGDRDTGLKLLERHRQEEDLRSFEWSHLWRRCHADRLNIATGHISALAFSPDGRALVTVGQTTGDAPRGDLQVWDTSTGQSWGNLAAPKAPVRAVAWAPGGHILAIGDEQGALQIWDMPAGKLRQAFAGHDGPIKALAFTADSLMLASAGADGAVRLWDANNGKAVGALSGHLGAVNCVAFSPDGKLLAAGCQGTAERKAGEIRLWQLSSAARGLASTPTQQAILQGHQGPVHGVAFSADGKTLASGGGLPGKMGELKLWDVATHQHKADLPGCFDRVLDLAYTPDGHGLAVAGADGTIKLWTMAQLPQLQLVLHGHQGSLTALALSADGDTLATAGADNSVKLWSLAQARGATVLGNRSAAPAMPLHSLAFAKFGNLPVLAAAGGDSGRGGVRIWDSRHGQLLAALERGLDRPVLAAAFSADGKLLATAGEDTLPRLWNWNKGSGVAVLRGHTHWVTSLAFAPRGGLVATGSADGSVRLWDADTGRQAATLPGHASGVNAVAFSPDGELLASAGGDHEIHLWKISAQQEAQRITGHTGPVLSVVFSADGKQLASAGADRTVRIWQTDNGVEVAVLHGHTHAVTSVAFTADGKSLASAGRDGAVRLWDILTGAPRAVFHGHADAVTALAFSPDGKMLASASMDSTVRLWQGEE